MTNQSKLNEDRYLSIVEAYNKGQLWSAGPCLTTACYAEGPINLQAFKNKRQSSFANSFW